jgi:hypothetical protein
VSTKDGAPKDVICSREVNETSSQRVAVGRGWKINRTASGTMDGTSVLASSIPFSGRFFLSRIETNVGKVPNFHVSITNGALSERL